jgi:hypothetical protein
VTQTATARPRSRARQRNDETRARVARARGARVETASKRVLPPVRSRRSLGPNAALYNRAVAGEAATITNVSPLAGPSPLAIVLSELRERYRLRCDYHSAEKRLTNQIKAVERRLAGQVPDENQSPSASNDEGGDHSASGSHPRAVAALVTVHLSEAREQLAGHRKTAEKRIEQLAQQLPVWPWAKAIRGVGALSLGQIIGECGDLSGYANPAKVWKRMGLAVINGGRQRRVAGEEALDHGYSPRRRAVMWNLGECLVKQNQEGEYRTLYLARKEVERAKLPDAPQAHVHNRAKRYMEKRFLRDLWSAWRRV